MSTTENRKIVRVAMSEYTPVAASEREDRGGWVRYGDDNLFPQYLLDMAETSPVHGALVTSIAQMIAGDGVRGVVQGVTSKLIDDMAQSLKLSGMIYLERIETIGGGLKEVNCLPFENCRLAKSDDDDEITGVYYCRDWTNTRKYKPQYIPLYDANAEGLQPRTVHVVYLSNPGSRYYARPDYWPSINYIELARQIGIYHVNNILNGLFPAFMVNFLNGVPDPEEKALIIREWERHASGARNAGKAFFTFGDPGTTAPQITTFPISDADKQYEHLSQLSTNQIMIGHRVTSSLLFGVRDSGNGLGSNSDEMRQAMIIFERQVIKPMQGIITDALKAVTGQDVEIQPYEIEIVEVRRPNPFQPAEEQFSEKKKCCEHLSAAARDMTDDDERSWIDYLKDKGEVIDEEEWELVREDRAGTRGEESDMMAQLDALVNANLSLSGYDNSEKKSDWGDSGLYKLRYAYSQNLSENSRDFCVEMVGLSKQGVVYRFEDIKAMSEAGENDQFAPAGQSTYDIFEWKGGVYCHHFWKRQIYFRKRKNGKFLPNDGLKNDIRVGNVPWIPQKGAEGIAPIDTPSRGSLKNP